MSQAKWLQIGFSYILQGKQKSCFHPTQCSIVGQNPMKCAIIIYQQISKSKTIMLNVAYYFFRPPRVHCVLLLHRGPLCSAYTQLAKYTHTIRMYQEQINMIFYFINQEYLSKHFMIKTCVCPFWSKKRLASLHSKKRH